MNIKTRLAQLEKQLPKAPTWPDFNVECMGVPRSAAQKEMIRRLRLYADDPRATARQREHWLEVAESIEPALAYELEHDRRTACPRCSWPLHMPVGNGKFECQKCCCPVHVHGDGRVTDARPRMMSASTENGNAS